MTGRYKNADVSFLVGSRLQQLALGMYEFQLSFSAEASISVQQNILVESAAKGSLKIQANDPSQTKELYFLLGCIVEDAQIDDEEVLKVVFNDQSRITIFPSDAGYDAYVIRYKGDFIAV